LLPSAAGAGRGRESTTNGLYAEGKNITGDKNNCVCAREKSRELFSVNHDDAAKGKVDRGGKERRAKTERDKVPFQKLGQRLFTRGR